MSVADTYENRAAFLIALHGIPSDECKRQFPDWFHQRQKLKSGSAEETIWFCEFAHRAVELRDAAALA